MGTHRQEGRPFTASSSKWKDNIISSIGDNLGNVHMLILLGTLLETLLENLLETLLWTQVRTLFEILLPIMIKILLITLLITLLRTPVGQQDKHMNRTME